ncbi:MAG: bifunctional nuclease family protein [Nitrospirae bacterium]|nr:bifunctional nuclease family protein [Nitrospirota bacterium]
MLIQIKVKGMMFDPLNNAYIVILRDENNAEILPIWVGKAEANAISLALEGITPSRPLTHDLIKNILDSLKASVISCVITDLKDNTYFSKLHIMFNDWWLENIRPEDFGKYDA